MKHIFTGNVHHNKDQFVKGQEVPASLLKEMQEKGLAVPLPEAVKPVEPPKPVVPRGDSKASKPSDKEE